MANTRDVRIHDALGSRVGLGRQLLLMLADIRRGWALAGLMFEREVRTRYRQSILGVAWALLPSIISALGMVAATRGQVVQVGATPIVQPAFVVIGVVLWQTFSESVTGPISAVSSGRSILTRITFPRESLVIAKLFEILLSLAIRLLLVAAVLIHYGITPGASALLLPICFVVLIAFGLLIGVLLAPLSLVTDDIQRGVSVVLMGWMFATSVFYAPRGDSLWARVVAANPVTVIIDSTRECIGGLALSSPVPFALIGVIAIVGLVVTGLLFRSAVPYALERIN